MWRGKKISHKADDLRANTGRANHLRETTALVQASATVSHGCWARTVETATDVVGHIRPMTIYCASELRQGAFPGPQVEALRSRSGGSQPPAPTRTAAADSGGLGDWKSCSGSRSRTARTRWSSRRIWSSSRTACSGCGRKPGWQRCVVRRAIQLRQPATASAGVYRQYLNRRTPEWCPCRRRPTIRGDHRASCSAPTGRVPASQVHPADGDFPAARLLRLEPVSADG